MMIKKAIFPVAGFGTRFLPATKATPKEMLPIIDKPLIQFAVEEAISAGITELIFVTNYNKRAIEDHFDTHFELESLLKKQGKTSQLKVIQDIVPNHITCTYVRQKEAKGLGHAIACAAHLIQEQEFFAVILADDFIYHPQNSALKQMMALHQTHKASVIASMVVPPDKTSSYGMMALDEQNHITALVEKPEPANSPSQHAVIGRYILKGSLFSKIKALRPGQGNEMQLTDAIATDLNEHPYLSCNFDGRRFDCGSKIGYLEANLYYAHKSIQDPQLKQRLLELIEQ